MIGYIIWDIEPAIFPSVPIIRWYGLCWALGAIAGYSILQKIFERDNQNIEFLDKVSTSALIAGIIGARLGHILFYDLEYYMVNPVEILPFKFEPTFQFTGLTGLASHGGVLVALLTVYILCLKHKVAFLWILDRLVIVGAILGAFIRFGNLLNSEIIGVPTTLPWGVIFSKVDMLPRHPTQLYESLAYFLVGFTLYLIWKKNLHRKSDGLISGLGITLIFCSRFLIEFIKEKQVAFEDTLQMKMGQILSIPMIIIGISLVIYWNNIATSKA